MKDYIISIGGGKMQLPLINAIKEQGYGAIVVDKDKNCPGKALADYFINKSTYEPEEILRQIKALPIPVKIAAVITKSSGQPVLTTATIAQKFNLPGIPVEIAELGINKSKLMDFLHNNSINCPKSKMINDVSQLSSPKFPAIIKPSIPIKGKDGIKKVNSIEELYSNFEYTKKLSYDGNVDFEEYIEGKDYNAVLVVKNKKLLSLMVMDEINIITPDGVRGLGFSIPSCNMNDELKARFKSECEKIIEILNITDAIFLISFRADLKNTYVIEMHFDLLGEYIFEKFMPMYAKTDFLSLAVKIYTKNTENIYIEGNLIDSYSIFFTYSDMENIEDKMRELDKNYDVIEKDVESTQGKGRTGYVILKNLPDLSGFIEDLYNS